MKKRCTTFIEPEFSPLDRVRVTNPASEFCGATGDVYRVWEGIVWVRLVKDGREASVGFRPGSLEKGKP